MFRDKFVLKNNKVYGNDMLLNGLTYEYGQEGMRNKVALIRKGKTVGFLKSSSVIGVDYYSDYAEIVTKIICDLVGIKCADVLLVDIEGLPKTAEQIELEKKEDEKSMEIFSSLSIEEQLAAERFIERQRTLRNQQKGVLSYNYLNDDKYKTCQKLNMATLCEKFNQFTEEDVPSSAEGYMNIIKFLHNNTEFCQSLGFNNIYYDENLKYDFLALSMLSFFTGQLDMTKYNIDLLISKTAKGYKVELAPLFDNGESFGLSVITRKENFSQEDYDYYSEETIKSVMSIYPSRLPIKEETQESPEDQAKEIADYISTDPMAMQIYNQFKSINIDKIVDSLDIGEPNFDIIGCAIKTFYTTRLQSVEQYQNSNNEEVSCQ